MGIPKHGSLSVPDRHFDTMQLLCGLRRSMKEIGDAIAFAGPVVSAEELRDVARRIRRLEAKVEFGMGTIDQGDLDLAMKEDA